MMPGNTLAVMILLYDIVLATVGVCVKVGWQLVGPV